MAWKISLSPSAKRNIDKLDIQIGRRILKFLHERISPLDDPRSIGDPLTGPRLGSYWRYRVGDYRILCEIQDNTLFILVVEVAHRREVYRK